MMWKPKQASRNTRRVLHTSLTALVVLAVLALSLTLTAISQAVNLFVDTTSDGRYTAREQMFAILESAAMREDVDILFCSDPDRLLEGQNTGMVYILAKELEKRLPNIHVSTVSVAREPEAVAPYRRTSATKIDGDDVILISGTEFRVLDVLAFFTRDGDTKQILGFNGEQKFCETILSLTAHDLPLACFTVGHGETVPRQDDEQTASFYELLRNAGFAVATIDLETENIPSSCTLLIVNGPTSDFPSGRLLNLHNDSPITKIDRFLNGFGTVFYFRDPTAPALPHWEEFLSEWGIGFCAKDAAGTVFPGGRVMDTSSALSGDPTRISGVYGTSSAFDDIASLSSPPKTVFENPAALSVLWRNGSSSRNSVGRVVETLFSTSDKAQVLNTLGETVTEGTFPLMTMTSETRIVDSEYMTATLFVSSTTAYCAESYLADNVFANGEVLTSILRGAARTVVSTAEQLEFKYYASPAFVTEEDAAENILYARDEAGNVIWKADENGVSHKVVLRVLTPISPGEQTAWVVVLVVLPFVLLLGAATAVYLRRKFR